ncbi:MAG: hypothetical protein H6837_21250 [Planctomycetes bacterium]|nr:hypothetical protein [Planctomycetota bacterium]
MARWLVIAGFLVLAGCGRVAPGSAAALHQRRAVLRAAHAQVFTDASRAVSETQRALRDELQAVWRGLLEVGLELRLDPEHEVAPSSWILHIHVDEPETMDEQIALMARLPRPCRFKLIVRSDVVEAALRRRLAEQRELLRRCDFIRAPAGAFLSIWSRDFAVGDERQQVRPMRAPRSGTQPLDDANAGDTAVVDVLQLRGTSVLRAPLFFSGGNLVTGRQPDGRTILFCGASDFRITEDLYRQAGLSLTDATYCRVLEAAFGVDRAVLLGTRNPAGGWLPQSKVLFHLDQAMLLHAPGRAVVHELCLPRDAIPEAELRPRLFGALAELARRYGLDLGAVRSSLAHGSFHGVARPESASPAEWARDVARFTALRVELDELRQAYGIRRDLESYADGLRRHGFAVTRLPLDLGLAMRRQFHLNAVWVPRPGAPALLLMPEFGDRTPGARQHDQRAAEQLSKLGCTLVPIPDLAHRGAGGPHCLIRRG